MKKQSLRISFWFSISLFAVSIGYSCKCSKHCKTQAKEPATISQPKPLMEAQTDSLKNYLDTERARRLKK